MPQGKKTIWYPRQHNSLAEGVGLKCVTGDVLLGIGSCDIPDATTIFYSKAAVALGIPAGSIK